MITANTLAKSGIVLPPPDDPLLGGGLLKLVLAGADVLSVALPAAVDDEAAEEVPGDDVPGEDVPAEELELLEPLMLRRFGRGGGVEFAERVDVLGESSRVDGVAAAAAAETAGAGVDGAAFGRAAVFFAGVGFTAALVLDEAFGLVAVLRFAGLAAAFGAAGFRGVARFAPVAGAFPAFVAPLVPSLSASLTAIPRKHCFRSFQNTRKCFRCTAPH
jgi:hypothetical protein